jgi:cytochrome P450
LTIAIRFQGNTMAFGLLELAKNPDFQTDLRTEIYSYTGNSDRNVAYDTMPLLNAFIKVSHSY